MAEFKLVTHLNAQGQQIKKYSDEQLTSDPSTGLFEGRKYYNTTSHKTRIYNGTAWEDMGSGASGVVETIVAASTKITVDATDPANPEIDVAVAELVDDTQSTTSNIYSASKVDSQISDAISGQGLGSLALKNTIDSSTLIDDEVVTEAKLSTAVQTKLNANASQNNTTATTDPTVNDDSSDGYSVKSLWLNQSSGEAFMCFDATVGAAVWKKTTLTVDELGALALKNTIDSSSLIDNHVVSYAKIQQVGAKKILGNSGSSTANVGEIAATDLGLSLLNATDAAAARTAISAVAANSSITGATKTKITYDSKGLVTGGDDATTADIADSTDKRYVTDAQLNKIGNIGQYQESFVSGDFTGGVLTIDATTHGLGTNPLLLNASVRDADGNIVLGGATISPSGSGDVTINVNTGLEFNGTILITRNS